MGIFFGRDGEPLEPLQWMDRFENIDYRVVKNEEIAGSLQVCTVWQGTDMSHRFDGSPPHIFETMVFSLDPTGDSRGEMSCCHYATESEAVAGHDLIASGWRELIQQIKDSAP